MGTTFSQIGWCIFAILSNMNQAENMISWNEHLRALQSFEEKLLKILTDLRILDTCKQMQIDHVCTRLSTYEDVDLLRQDLQNFGEEISVAEVNGREIVMLQLYESLQIAHWQVEALELPYPKKNHTFADGWEHVEFVVPNVGNSIEVLRAEVLKILPDIDLDTLNYKEDTPHVIGEQLANPTVAIKVNGLGVKFHANSIQDVVRSG